MGLITKSIFPLPKVGGFLLKLDDDERTRPPCFTDLVTRFYWLYLSRIRCHCSQDKTDRVPMRWIQGGSYSPQCEDTTKCECTPIVEHATHAVLRYLDAPDAWCEDIPGPPGLDSNQPNLLNPTSRIRNRTTGFAPSFLCVPIGSPPRERRLLVPRSPGRARQSPTSSRSVGALPRDNATP